MPRERWIIDDIEITNGWVQDVETREGLYDTAGPTGTNGTTSARTGELWVPKILGPGRFTLSLWVGGGNATELQARYDALVRLLMRPGTLRKVRRFMPDGSVRACDAEVVSGLTPTPSGSTVMRLTVEFNVPSGMWQAENATTVTGVAGAGTKILNLTGALSASTAPLERLSITVTGPISDFTIEDRSSPLGFRSWFGYVPAIASGHTVTFNCDTYGVSQTGGHSINMGAIRHNRGRYLMVEPVPEGKTMEIQMTGSGTGAATNLSVNGKAAFLV